MKIFILLLTLLAGGQGTPAQAAEFGTGLYVLGYQSSLAGYLPDPGFYLRYDFYYYQGNAKILAFSGKVEADLRSRLFAHLVTGIYVTPYKVLGANYGLGVIWNAASNSFLKGQLDILSRDIFSREGNYTGVGDLVLTPVMLGWHQGNFHITNLWNLYAPTGAYNIHRRINTGLNRWALEPNVALTWLNPQREQEVSMALGYTMNLRNQETHYTTGQEFHLEYFLGQHLPHGFALGLAGYLYKQITGDSGPGAASLGKFYGRTLALGPCLSFNSKLAGHPISLNARYYNELAVKNRLDGQSLFFTCSVGL